MINSLHIVAASFWFWRGRDEGWNPVGIPAGSGTRPSALERESAQEGESPSVVELPTAN